MPQYPFYNMICLSAMKNGGEVFCSILVLCHFFTTFLSKSKPKTAQNPKTPLKQPFWTPKNKNPTIKHGKITFLYII